MTYETQRRLFSITYTVLPLALIPMGFYELHWLLVSILFFYFAVLIGIECGLHRFFTHNSYKTSRFWEYALSLLPMMVTAGSPIVWTAIHRAHHQRSDTELDPHSPKHVGLLKLVSVMWRVDHIPLKVQFPRSINFKFQRFLHEHYYKLVLVYIVILALIDFKFVIYFWALPSLLAHVYQQAVNILSHQGQYSNETHDYSVNRKFIGWFFPQLGYHHEHHLKPNAHRIGRPDLPAAVIERVFGRG